ncbi:MAG: flippase-like domain-containing protein [Thermoleophilia bacterium]|nr:flippase-like domain-containing protein [Thermoleophilia bacterium]
MGQDPATPGAVSTLPGEAARPPRRWDRRRVLGLAAGLLVLAALGWTLVRGWSTVSTYDWELSPGWLVAGVVILLGFYVVTALAYEEILSNLHQPLPPERVTVSVWAKSLLGRYVPGNVMLVVGRVVMAEATGVPKRVTLAATAYEQVLAIGAAASGALLIVLEHGSAPVGAAVWLLALIPVSLVVLHPRVFRPASTWILARVGRAPLVTFLSGRQVVLLLGWYVVTTVMLGAGVWTLVRAAAGPEAGGPIEVGAGFLLAFVVAMIAFIFPSGLGVRDGAFALVLAQNIPGSVAVAVAVGVRFALVLIELVFVAGAVLWGRRR